MTITLEPLLHLEVSFSMETGLETAIRCKREDWFLAQLGTSERGPDVERRKRLPTAVLDNSRPVRLFNTTVAFIVTYHHQNLSINEVASFKTDTPHT
jgi:hypothetical protein